MGKSADCTERKKVEKLNFKGLDVKGGDGRRKQSTTFLQVYRGESEAGSGTREDITKVQTGLTLEIKKQQLKRKERGQRGLDNG